MKINKEFFKFICFIFVFLLICTVLVSCGNKKIESQDVFNAPDDSILYNNAYNYTLDENIFLLKERGYDFFENYNESTVRIAKKELFVMFNTKEVSEDYLIYEIFENDAFILRGILYKDSDYYYSNLTLNNLREFSEKLTIRILNKEEKEIYKFDLKEV